MNHCFKKQTNKKKEKSKQVIYIPAASGGTVIVVFKENLYSLKVYPVVYLLEAWVGVGKELSAREVSITTRP